MRQNTGERIEPFARRVSVSRRTVEMIELQGHQPRPEIVARIAIGLGVPVEELYLAEQVSA